MQVDGPDKAGQNAKAAAPDPTAEPGSLSHREILVVFAGLMLGMLLAALDQTIVSVALPTIVGDLGGLEQLSWVVTAYMLTSTAFVPLYGKISDLYGRKIVFQAAIAIFILGSLLAGFAQTMVQLIVTRGIQGIGGGGLMALAMAIIGDVVSPRQRGRYVGYLGSVWAFASIAGPLIGGFFVDQLSWRWIFYINIPLGILALVVTTSVLRLPSSTTRHKIDWLGAALLVAGVASLQLALVWGGSEYPWGSPTIVSLVAGSVLMLGLFLFQENRTAEPILPLRLFRNPIFSVGTGLAFVIGTGMFGGFVFLPLFLQAVGGASATNSGLLMLPMMVGVMTASIGSGRIITNTGRYKIWPIMGTAFTTVGMALLSTMGPATPRWQTGAFMLVTGAGMGMVMQVLTLVVQNAVDYKDLGVATSSTNFFRSMGGTVGVAVFGAVFAARLRGSLPRLLPADAAANLDVSELANSPAQIRALPPDIQEAVVRAIAIGVQGVFRWAIPLLAVSFVAAWFLKEIPLRDTANVTSMRGPGQTSASRDQADRSGALTHGESLEAGT